MYVCMYVTQSSEQDKTRSPLVALRDQILAMLVIMSSKEGDTEEVLTSSSKQQQFTTRSSNCLLSTFFSHIPSYVPRTFNINQST